MASGYNLSLYGRKIYLLGTSNLGPVNTPIKIQSASHVKQVFGEDGTLLDAYRVIKESDFDCDVYMVKVTGIHSELYLNINVAGGEIINNGFYIKAKYANEMYDNTEIIIDSDAVYINYTTDEIGNYTLEYKYHMEDEYGNPIYDKDGNLIYKTLFDLAEEINEDTRNLVSNVYCYANCEPGVMANSALVGVNSRVNMLSGGNSGLYYNKNMMFNCLSDTYGILEGRDVDLIIPLACYFDDTWTDDSDALSLYYDLEREYLTLKENGEWVSYYKQLLEFCKVQMRFGYMTHGIMGLNRIKDAFIDQDTYYEKLVYFKSINENDKDYDKYRQLVSVCVGDLYSTYGTRIYNSYIAYASLVANLVITENTTNKPLPNSFTTFIDFDQRMLNKLKDLGFTTFRYSIYKKTVVCANGVTTSEDKAFKYFTNMRMCQLAMCKIRELLMTFIGENINTLIETREIEQSVINLMNQLVVAKVLSGFGINSITNPNTGHVMLDISFRTQYMLESIRAYSGLTTVRYGDDYGF
jgi:hypothetical protein